MKYLKLLLLTIISFTPSAQTYKIVNRFPIPGNDGWDDLSSDAETQRLFVSHGTVVNVMDENTGKLLGTIPDTHGVHGIALADDLEKGFISDGRDSAVTIFNLQTLAVITKAPVTGLNPDAIIYDRFSRRVFAFNGRTKNATVIDARDNKVIATIPLDGKPEFAVSDGKGRVFVNIKDKNEISEINSTSLNVVNTWPIAPGEGASGLAIDVKNKRLFTVCHNRLMIILDAENGRVVSKAPIGNNPDGAGFDPELKRAYSSNGDGTITVVQEQDPNNFKVVETILTQKGARTMTIDKKTHHLFLPVAEFGEKPEPTRENPHHRPAIKPGTFTILDVAVK